MADYVVAQAAVLIVPTLDKFRERLEKELRRIQTQTGPIEIDGRFNSKKVMADFEATKAYLESRDINVNARINPKQLTEIRHVYEDLSRDFKKGLFLNLKVTGMSVLPELANGLAAANASMVQLAQSAALLPGLLATAASSIAAVATGLSGVKEAFKEYSDAQKNAAQDSLKARNSAKNVQNAYRDLGRSFKDARRNLEDLNAELRGAPLDEAEAIIAIAEARAEAADKAGKSGLQQQKDAIALAKAENALVDVRLRNSRLIQDVAEANAKGVAGSDAVVEATERLSKAQDEAATQTIKLTDALQKVSPNAQAFFQAVTGMSSQWEAFKNATQDRLFANLDGDITRLAQVGLPTLQKGLGDIADAVNNNVRTAFAALGKQETQGLLSGIFANTADAQERLSKAIEPFLDGFLRISEVGSSFMPRLVDGLGQLAQRFENFITVADNNGSLDEWINNGIDAFKQLGDSIMNIGSILNSLSEAFTGSGGTGMLELLQEATQRLADFLKTDAGQQKLMNFFTEARDALEDWKPLLSTIPDLFNTLATTGEKVSDMILPFLTAASSLLGNHAGLVSEVLRAYMAWKMIGPIIGGISNFLKSDLVESLKSAAGAVGGLGKAGGLRGAFDGLASMISPGGIVMSAFTSLVAYLTYQYVRAQNEAAQAANDHAAALQKIGTQVDSVTGKLTQSGLVDQLEQLGRYTNNQLEGDPTFDIVAKAQEFSIASAGEIANSLLPSEEGRQAFTALQETNKQIIKDALINTKDGFYAKNQSLLEGAGITLDDVAAAVAGDSFAADKLDRANLGFNAVDIIQGYNGLLPSQDVAGLPEKALIASQLGRSLTELRRNTASQSARSVTAAEALGGTATMIPGTVLDRLGNPQPTPLPDGSGGVKISVDTPKDQIELNFPNLFKLIEEKNGTITADAVGSTITFADPNIAREFVTIQKRAAGGLITGPGGPRSDSILTALSNGEYVVNAASTRKHLPLLESINGGGMPGFYAGGPVPMFPQAPTPTPAPPVPPVSDSPVGLGSLLGADSALEVGPMPPIQAPGRVSTPQPGAVANPPAFPTPGSVPAVGDIPAPSDAAPATSGGTISNSTDSRVNPTTTVHSGTKPSAGPGNVIPHQVAGLPSRPGPYQASVSSGFIPGGSILPQGIAAGSEAGLRSSTIRGRRALLAAFPFLQEVGGYRQDSLKWHPNGQALDPMIPASLRFTPQGYALGDSITQWALQNAGDLGVEHVIWNKKIYYPDGRSENMRVTGDKTQDHEDHPHIVFSESAYPTEGSQYFAPASGITPFSLDSQGFPVAGSPSNMALAGTPTGVMLPQFTYTGGRGSGASGSGSGSGGLGGIRLPTPEEYAKYVSDAWISTLNDLVKNAGQIAIGFLGSFFGLDLSKITGLANSVMGGIDLPGANEGRGGDSGGDVTSQLGAIPDVDSILQAAGQLPPEYQQAYVDAALANPSQAGSILQQLMQSIPSGASGVGSVQYDPNKGAEQWRPVVRKILSEVGASYGITNLKAWEDDIVGQINFESRGNPGAQNLNDTDGKGGIQQVFGLGQFLPTTFAAHNRSGGDISDPVAQIYAMIDYLASPKYGVIPNGGVNWKGVGWRNGKGYAMGGKIKGPGGGRSDSIIARVSNGEYIVRAPMAQKHMGLLEAINSNKLPGFADGGLIPLQPIPPTPAPPPPPPVTTPPPPPSPLPPAPAGPQADAAAGMPSAPTPVTEAQGPGDAESTALKDVGAALGGIGSAISGVADGATAPAGDNPEGDPRATLGAAPQNLDHNKPAVSQGIQAAAGAIAGAVSTAMQAASVGANAAAPGSGQGLSSAAGIVNGLISAGGSAVVGAVNVLSSLGVGTVTPSTSTAGAYGAPLTPEGMGQQPYQGPSVVNNWNGGVHTSNNEEFYKLQQRRELQNAAPYLPQR